MGTASDGDRPWQSYHTVFTNAKAGMEGVNKEKVQRIVYEMSKGSKYFENEKRKEELMRQKIDNLRSQCAKLSENDIAHYQKIADKKVLELELSRDLSKVWLHCDMDAFYAAVETLENPSLEGKPLAVGSMSMICTANYEARKFGVRAAMPGFIASKLCPGLLFVPTDFKKYTHYSELTRQVFQKYDPDFIATSLDEAYLNVTNACEEGKLSGEEIAAEIRNAIYKETGLTCSIGVAPNRMLAKVCSDINKPNGQFILQNDKKAVTTFVSTLPIRKIGGIGKVTEHMLKDVLGITTCEEMLKNSAYILALFSHFATDFFLSVGLGLGRTDTPDHKLRKSISTERTFSSIEDEALIFQKLVDIAATLSSDMQKECLYGRTLTLKLKTSSFEVKTRAVTLEKYIQSKDDILCHASKLLKAELPLSLRLMGLRMSHFQEDKSNHFDPTQKTLTGFVVSTNASPSDTYENSSICPDIGVEDIMHNDHTAVGDENNCFSNKDPNTCSTSSNQWGPAQMPNSSTNSKLAHPDGVSEQTNKRLRETESDEHPEPSWVDGYRETESAEHPEPSWVDGYSCSLCGIELPPNFIEERQEHADYHLARRLQDEYMQNMKQATQQQIYIQKSLQVKGAPKKHRSHQKEKYIPIDAFFTKQ